MRALDWLILAATVTAVGVPFANRISGTFAPGPRWRCARALVRRAVPSWWSAFVTTTIAATGVVWTAERGLSPGESQTRIVAAWLISIVSLILAVWRPSRREITTGVRDWTQEHRLDVGIAALLAALAAVPMLFKLDSYPWAFNGDEGQFALSAKAILDGQRVDVFGTGWLGHPNAYFYLEAAAMSLVGESVEGARLVGAIFGILAVPLVYAFGARLFSRGTGVLAAVLLGTFHVNLFWSRNALNNGASTFFVLLTMLLLAISLDQHRRTAFVLTGTATGLAQFFYMGNRAISIAICAMVLCAAIQILAKRDRPIRPLVDLVGNLGLVACGALVVVMPLAAHYSRFPEEFDARSPAVSIFGSGWLDHQRSLGRSSIEIFTSQFRDAAMIPFATHVGGQYRGLPPFIGWPMAVAAFAGLLIATARIRTMQFRLVSVTYWVFAAAMATTVPPMATNRFVAAIPLLCIFGAIPIATMHDLLIRFRAPRWSALFAAGVVTGLISAWSLVYYFHDPNQVDISSDGNTQVSEYLARDILAIDPSATVYFAGPPRMWYDGFGNLVFRTPNVMALNVEQPWTRESEKPPRGGTIIFVALPERASELSVVRTWYPDGETIDRSDDEVGRLYTVYIVRQPQPDGSVPVREPVPRAV